MTFSESTAVWQRWLLAAALVGSAVIVLPPAVEPFMLPKVTFVVALTLALVAVGAARMLWARMLHVPVSPLTLAVGVFAVALVVVTVTSPAPLTSTIGSYGRYTGLVPYLAYLTLFFVALRLAGDALVRLLTRAGLATLGIVVAYGLLQAAGLDPLNFTKTDLGTTFSFLGNVDFAAAWTGAMSALALAAALSPHESRPWRLYAAGLLPLALLFALVTGAAQGPVVAVVSLGFAGLVLLTSPGTTVRTTLHRHRRPAMLVGAAAATAVAAVVLGALTAGRGRLLAALGERGEFYTAAFGIFRDHPVLGTGLDTYGHHFQAYRPASHALVNNLATTDAPHSVPIGMFSNGGVLLGLSYLVVVALIAVALVRGVVRVEGPSRLALAGFGGVWLGYQAQSLISFDVPPLAVLHWLSAGIVVALGWPPRWRPVALPGTAAARRATRTGKEYGDPVVPVSTRVLQGVVALVAVAGLWLVAYPLRADLVSASAAPLASSGKLNAAIAKFARAAELNPAEPTYALLAARAYAAGRRPELALRAAEEAAQRDPGTVGYALFAAQQARLAQMRPEALRWYREAVRRDPLNPPVLLEAADYLIEAGVPAEAEVLLERSASVRADAGTYVRLGRARLAQQDAAGARTAVEQALALDPANEAAKQLLAQVS